MKRAIDDYHKSCVSTVGAGRYIPQDFTFKSFEKFLYEALKKLQQNGSVYMKGLPEPPSNPLLCTRSTNRCMHATHAYTGVPCAAYCKFYTWFYDVWQSFDKLVSYLTFFWKTLLRQFFNIFIQW